MNELAPLLARFGDGWPARLDVGPGWHAILIALGGQLAATDPGYTLRQVKQDCGGLDVFYDLSDSVSVEDTVRFRDAVRAARDAAAFTCEVCGLRGRTTASPSGWVRVLCFEHAEQLKKGQEQ